MACHSTVIGTLIRVFHKTIALSIKRRQLSFGPSHIFFMNKQVISLIMLSSLKPGFFKEVRVLLATPTLHQQHTYYIFYYSSSQMPGVLFISLRAFFF